MGESAEENQTNLYEQKKLLTAVEVGNRLRISLSTVHHLTRTGQIRAVKVGKQWRYVEEDVEHYLWGGFDYRKQIQERRKSDRRVYPRISCFIQGVADISTPNTTSKKWEGNGTAVNISEGGMLFEIAESEPAENVKATLSDQVSICLYFPSSVSQKIDGIDLEGKIARFDNNSHLRFGIFFDELSLEANRIIQHYIKQGYVRNF